MKGLVWSVITGIPKNCNLKVVYRIPKTDILDFMFLMSFHTKNEGKRRTVTKLNSTYCPGWKGFKITGP